MKRLFRKLKEWATDAPGEPYGTLAELYLPKVPTFASLKPGLPFQIRWESEAVRNDN